MTPSGRMSIISFSTTTFGPGVMTPMTPRGPIALRYRVRSCVVPARFLASSKFVSSKFVASSMRTCLLTVNRITYGRQRKSAGHDATPDKSDTLHPVFRYCRQMHVDWIKAYVTVAERGGFLQAAQTLGRAQSRISEDRKSVV